MAIDNLEFRNACRNADGSVERDKGEETVCTLSEEDTTRQVSMDEKSGTIRVDTRDVEAVVSDPRMAYGGEEGMHVRTRDNVPLTIRNQRQADIKAGVEGAEFSEIREEN